MLIISIPKSASTNLWISVAAATGLNKYNIKRKPEATHFGDFNLIAQLWSDAGIRYKSDILKWGNDREGIYRKHILPVEENISSISKISEPAIVLLRNPKKIPDALIRSSQINSNFDRKELLKQFRKYYEIYDSHELNGKVLRVYFEKLVLDWENHIKKICDHFNLPVIYEIENIKKRRYTGVGLKELQK